MRKEMAFFVLKTGARKQLRLINRSQGWILSAALRETAWNLPLKLCLGMCLLLRWIFACLGGIILSPLVSVFHFPRQELTSSTPTVRKSFQADKSARCIFTACACTVSAWECIILCFVFPCPTKNWTILWKFMSIAR